VFQDWRIGKTIIKLKVMKKQNKIRQAQIKSEGLGDSLCKKCLHEHNPYDDDTCLDCIQIKFKYKNFKHK
jgi:hypothetical protein